MCSGLAQLLFDGWQIPACMSNSNSLRAAMSFSCGNRRARATHGGPCVSMKCVMPEFVDTPGCASLAIFGNCAMTLWYGDVLSIDCGDGSLRMRCDM